MRAVVNHLYEKFLDLLYFRFDSKSCELNLQDLNPLQHEFWAYQQYNRSKLCNVLFR